MGFIAKPIDQEDERNFAIEATSLLCSSWRKQPSGQSLIEPEDLLSLP